MSGVGAVQRPRAPLLEAALVSQARRGPAASLQTPFSLPLQQRSWGSGLSGAGPTEAGKGAPYHKRVFPM